MAITDHNKDSKDSKDSKNKTRRAEQLRQFARLSGVAFQMGGTIFVCATIGKSLDHHYDTQKKWFTMGFVLFGLVASLYMVIKQLNAIHEKNDDR